MPSPQKSPYAIIDVMIDRPIRLNARTVREVIRPAPQNTVELIANLTPRRRVLRAQHVVHFLPQPAHALVGRLGRQIPKPLPRTMPPKSRRRRRETDTGGRSPARLEWACCFGPDLLRPSRGH